MNTREYNALEDKQFANAQAHVKAVQKDYTDMKGEYNKMFTAFTPGAQLNENKKQKLSNDLLDKLIKEVIFK